MLGAPLPPFAGAGKRYAESSGEVFLRDVARVGAAIEPAVWVAWRTGSLRKLAPLRRRMVQRCCRRSSSASTSAFF